MPMQVSQSLPALRFEIPEAAQILRISRALLYKRIAAGLIKASKDGKRTFITAGELDRYVATCKDAQQSG
jgi:excisionase family DNA binding protein